MKIEASIEWLKTVLPPEYADQIDDDWCWKEIGEWYRSGAVPDEVAEVIVQGLVASGDGAACYEYCRYVEDRADVRQAMMDSGDGWVCYLYCRYVKDRAEVRQVLIDSGDDWSWYYDCCYVKDRAKVRAVLARHDKGRNHETRNL